MSHPNDNSQSPRPDWSPACDNTELTIASTLLVVRPGDALFVMPAVGEHWASNSREQIAAIIKERLPEVRIIVLPHAATFATVAVEDAHQP